MNRVTANTVFIEDECKYDATCVQFYAKWKQLNTNAKTASLVIHGFYLAKPRGKGLGALFSIIYREIQYLFHRSTTSERSKYQRRIAFMNLPVEKQNVLEELS